MGNGTKVALVALLILMVVVIARFVRDDADEPKTPVKGGIATAGNGPSGKAAAVDPAKADPAKNRTLPGGAEKKVQVVRATGPAPPSSATGGIAPGTTAQSGGSGTAGQVTYHNTAAPPGAGQGGAPASTESAPGALTAAGPTQSVTGTMTGPAGPTTARPPAAVPPGSTASESTPGVVAGVASRPGNSLMPQPPPPGGTIRSELPEAGKTNEPPAVAHYPQPRLGPGTGTLALPSSPRPEPPPRDPLEHLRTTTPPSTPQAAPGALSFPLTHTVAKGESLWSIAQRHYKNGSLWPQIEKANPGLKLLPGKQLTIPAPVLPATESARRPEPPAAEPGKLQASLNPPPTPRKPETTPPGSAPAEVEVAGGTYVVQKGDTLSLIAKKFYRDANKYHLIEDANETLRYQLLRAGDKIKIPPLRK